MAATRAEIPAAIRSSTEPPEHILDFATWLNPRFLRPYHLAALTAELELSWTQAVRRTAHAPPRFAKTDTVLAFIARTLKKQPHRTIAYVSYGDRIAKSKSRRARGWAIAAGVRLADHGGSLNEWRTAAGGGLLATGIGGPLTSQGVDILVVDDPYKSRVQAESPAYREQVADWWGDVAETRLEPGASAFIFHTRWHTDDLIGHVSRGEDRAAWRHINMPALNEAGESLWPERWPVEALLQKQRSAGPYTWASLYQGTPRPRGGQVFGDVHFYQSAPTGGYRVSIGVDLAYSAKTHSDYSVAVVMAAVRQADGEDRFFILEVLRRQEQAPQFKERLALLKKRYPGASWRMYAAGTELGTADFMATGPDAVRIGPVNAGADKFIRAQPVAASWNAGHVLVREGAAWADEFVTELKDFTGVKDANDDQVDALAAAYDVLAVPAVKHEQPAGRYGGRRI